jgi:hypothetical protein
MTDNSTPPEDITGFCALVHGPYNSGKSRSSGTAPDPIYHMNKEDKTVEDLFVGCPKKMFFFTPDDLDDELATVNSWHEAAKAGKLPAKTVVNDGITFSQVKINQWLEESRRDERMASQKYRGAIDYARIDQSDIGGSNKLMIRIIMMYSRLSKLGVNVIMIAGSTIKDGIIVPTLSYKEVPDMISGVFNHIGYIIRPFQYDENQNPVPALITFAPNYEGQRYMCRTNSDRLMKAGPVPLHWTKIIELIREEQREAWEKARGVKKEGV